MNNPKKQQESSPLMSWFAAGAIIFALIVGILVYTFIMGNKNNFEGGDVLKGHPQNILGIIHRGGFIVPLLVAINIVVLAFFIERSITLFNASGKGNAASFVLKVRDMLASHKIDEAIAACDKQKGSLANVVRTGLLRYKLAAHDKDTDRDEKVAAIEKDLAELDLRLNDKKLITETELQVESLLRKHELSAKTVYANAQNESIHRKDFFEYFVLDAVSIAATMALAQIPCAVNPHAK